MSFRAEIIALAVTAVIAVLVLAYLPHHPMP
jgi:hypothetical protein